MYYARVKPTDVGAVTGGPNLDGVLVSIAYTAHYSGLTRAARRSSEVLMFHPETHLLGYEHNLDRASLRSLPYAWAAPLTPTGMRDRDTMQRFVSEVVETEEMLGADAIIAPFVLTDTQDHHALNLQLLRETLEASRLPVVGMITVPWAVYSDETAVSRVIREYSGIAVDEYHVTCDGFRETGSSARTVQSVFRTVRGLAGEGKRIFVSYLGALGSVSMGWGAAGYSGGIVWTDYFRSSAVRRPSGGGAGRGLRRTAYQYQPELFTALTEEDVRRLQGVGVIGECNCRGCDGVVPVNDNQRKLHLLEMRRREASDLANLNPVELASLTRMKLAEAEALSRRASAVLGKSKPFTHLERWRQALEGM